MQTTSRLSLAQEGTAVHHERHRAEQTTLYRPVQQHAATFFAQAEAAAGADLPQFVKDEFDAFLECGILAYGFLRLRCGDCGHDKLVAFSCKRRGFCPSCGAHRMAQTAAHLVELPRVPVRQWVLSLPIPLRLLLAAQPKLMTPVLQVVHRVITRYLKYPEQLCRDITRPALVNERVQTNAAGQAVLELETPWGDGTTHLLMVP